MSREYSWHCEQCEFDACNECLTYRATIPDHPHPLQITDARGAYPQYGGSWQCDICRINYQPNSVDDTGKPYHCAQCEYDVCSNCITSRIGNRFYHGKSFNCLSSFNLLNASCFHIETSQLICTANKLTGFFIKATLAFNGLHTAFLESFQPNIIPLFK